jgi:hypothetical protein
MPEQDKGREPRTLIFMSRKEVEPYAELAYRTYVTECGTFRRWEGLSSDQKRIWHAVARAILLPWRTAHEPGFKPKVRNGQEPEE